MLSSVSGLFDKAFYHIVTHTNGQSLASAYTLFQTICIHQESINPHVKQHALKIQTFFNIADVVPICLTIKEIGSKLNIDINRNWKLLGGALVAGAGCCMTAFLASILLNRYFQSHKNLNELPQADPQTPNNSAVLERPDSQLWAQQLFITRIILNTALTCLSPNKALPICNLLGQTYSLIKLSQFRWLKLSYQLPEHEVQERLYNLNVSYHALLPNPSTDAKTISDVYRCVNNSLANWRLRPRTQVVDQQGRLLRMLYDITIPQAAFPHDASNAYYEITIVDEIQVNGKAVMSVERDSMSEPGPTIPRFFEAVNLVYNLFQTGLAYTQQRQPELAHRILNAQRVLFVADAALLARDCVQLNGNLKEEKHKLPFRARIAAIAFPLSAAAAGVFLMNRYLKPATDLKGLLEATPKDLESLKIYWNSPRLHKLGELLSLSQISVNLFSAMITSGRKRTLHLTAASLQTLTLHKIFQLPWVKIEKTFTQSAIAAFPSSNAHCHAFKELKIEAHALLIPGMLSSTLKSTCDYVTNLFSNRSMFSTEVRVMNNVRFPYYCAEVPHGDVPPYIGKLTAWALGGSPHPISVVISPAELSQANIPAT